MTNAATGLVPETSIQPPSAKEIMLGSGPRFARDAFGPVLAFYLGYRLGGLAVGMVLASAAGIGAYLYERSKGRPGLMSRIALGFVAIQAVVGLVSDSAVGYLAPQVLMTGAFGLVFTVSALFGRPLAGVFAAEMVDLPAEVRASATYRKVFGRISLAWGVFLLVRAGLRWIALTSVSVDAFVLVNFVTGAPMMPLMLSWSVWYGVRAFRRSQEWGWAFTEPSPAPAELA